MTPEVKAAMHRLREAEACKFSMSGLRLIYSAAHLHEPFLDCRVENDRYILSEAYLATHQADDGEAVSEEWLRSIGFEQADTLRDALTNGVVYFAPPCGPLGWWCGIGNELNEQNRSFVPVQMPKTRGQVRKLLEALGLTTDRTSNPLNPKLFRSDHSDEKRD